MSFYVIEGDDATVDESEPLQQRVVNEVKHYARCQCTWRELFEAFIKVTLWCMTIMAASFNVFISLPNHQSLFVDYSYRYQLFLCAPLLFNALLNVTYLMRRRQVAWRTEPIHVSPVQVAVIIFMALCCITSYAVYLVPFEFVFWICDAVLETVNDEEKYIDIVYYVVFALYLSIFLYYCLQRSSLTSDRERGENHTLENLQSTFNVCVLLLVFVRVVCEKIHVVFLHMVCPSAVANNNTVLDLAICHSATHGHDVNHCHHNETLNWQLALWAKVDMKLFRPAIYVITAELMPLLYVLHYSICSTQQLKTRPESYFARFELPQLPEWLVIHVYRSLVLLLLPSAGILCAYRLYALGDQLKPERSVTTAVITHPSVAWTFVAYYIARAIIFGLIFATILYSNPARYTWPKSLRRPQLKLRKSYRTLLVAHSFFDSSVILIAIGFKFIICVCAIGLAAKNLGSPQLADVCQLISMITEWLLLRQMLILNDSELKLWPLYGRGTLGLGAALCASATASSMSSFGEEFVRHCLLKMRLADPVSGASSSLLAAVAVNESFYFGVSLYYFTCAMCWLELFWRYVRLGAVKMGQEPAEIQKSRRCVTMNANFKPVPLPLALIDAPKRRRLLHSQSLDYMAR